MSNTRRSIIETIQIKDYTLKAKDVFAIDSKTGAVFGEIQGRRETQEDQMDAVELPGFELLSFSGQEKVLKDVMHFMHKDTDPKGEVGSAVCAGVAWKKENKLHVTTANLGDSEAYAVIVAANGYVHATRVNKNLHKPNEPTERARLKKTDREPLFFQGAWRLGSLAVSRAIGDKLDLTEPDDHVPDVNGMEISIAADDKAYLLVACDGLFERLESDEVKQNFIEESFRQAGEPDRVIERLIDSAYRRSGDNISAVILPVKSAQAVSAAVFDGHGGSDISSNLGQYFYPVLRGLVDAEVKHRKSQVRGSEMIGNASDVKEDLMKKAMQLKAIDMAGPFSLLSRMKTAVAASENKKETLINRLPALLKNASRSDILDVFKALEDVNGEFAWIHQQRHSRFDKFRMFFGGHSKNVGEEKNWHTSTYQQAVKILKDKYLKAAELTDESRLGEEARFIDYRRGNTPKLFAVKKTSLRKAFEQEAAHPDRVKLMKGQ